jgi:hypothetical protein
MCDVRCAMCDVRCAMCDVRCAMCDVRCAMCDVIVFGVWKLLKEKENGQTMIMMASCAIFGRNWNRSNRVNLMNLPTQLNDGQVLVVDCWISLNLQCLQEWKVSNRKWVHAVFNAKEVARFNFAKLLYVYSLVKFGIGWYQVIKEGGSHHGVVVMNEWMNEWLIICQFLFKRPGTGFAAVPS